MMPLELQPLSNQLDLNLELLLDIKLSPPRFKKVLGGM